MQQEKLEKQNAPKQSTNFVGFFALKGDGAESIVRFAYATPDEMYHDVLTVHPGNADTKWKPINCINDLKAGVHDCPLCAAGIQLQQRFFIKLIEYTRNDDGTITANARVWNRPTSYLTILTNLFTEYGDISDCVFKVKRSGTGLDTTYNIMFGNPSIYNSQLYPKDFSAFDGYEIIGGQVLDKTKAELGVMAREMTGFDSATIGTTDQITPTTQQTFTPQSAMPGATPTSPAGDPYAPTPGVTLTTSGTATPTGGQRRVTY